MAAIKPTRPPKGWQVVKSGNVRVGDMLWNSDDSKYNKVIRIDDGQDTRVKSFIEVVRKINKKKKPSTPRQPKVFIEPKESDIPEGWKLVTKRQPDEGDKYWNYREKKFVNGPLHYHCDFVISPKEKDESHLMNGIEYILIPEGWSMVKGGNYQEGDEYLYKNGTLQFKAISQDVVGTPIHANTTVIRKKKQVIITPTIPEGWERVQNGERSISGDKVWVKDTFKPIHVHLNTTPDVTVIREKKQDIEIPKGWVRVETGNVTITGDKIKGMSNGVPVFRDVVKTEAITDDTFVIRKIDDNKDLPSIKDEYWKFKDEEHQKQLFDLLNVTHLKPTTVFNNDGTFTISSQIGHTCYMKLRCSSWSNMLVKVTKADIKYSALENYINLINNPKSSFLYSDLKKYLLQEVARLKKMEQEAS